MEFIEFPKIARLSRECIVTEKIDGTNASIYIPEVPEEPVLFGSRTRWITPENDNYGFARWATENLVALNDLGPGHHFGEWWGRGIQRGYGLNEKRFSLFNTSRWTSENLPPCVGVVPILYQGLFDTVAINDCLQRLSEQGSAAAPGFTKPEGIVVFHTKARVFFKKTILKDDSPKSLE